MVTLLYDLSVDASAIRNLHHILGLEISSKGQQTIVNVSNGVKVRDGHT